MEATQMCEENSKKRHRQSPSPSPPPSPPPMPSLLPIFGKEFDAINAKLKVNIDFDFPVSCLVEAGIIKDVNNLLRAQDLCKESWNCGWMPDITYEELELEYWGGYSENQLKEAENYMKSAADGKFFDVPLPKQRPDCISEGFFVIDPEKQDHPMFHDPVFDTRFNFTKFSAFSEKLGIAAVEYHKWITGSDLTFSRIVKANLYSRFCDQYYFITLEAEDKSGRVIKCQSMVRCAFGHSNWIALNKFDDDNPVVVDDIYVHSFCCVK